MASKTCDHCGVHYPGYQSAGDEVLDLCACCYGEPHDPAECDGQPPVDTTAHAAALGILDAVAELGRRYAVAIESAAVRARHFGVGVAIVREAFELYVFVTALVPAGHVYDYPGAESWTLYVEATL